MNQTIENYNKLVPLMNKLIKEGKEVDAFSDRYQGYGCYIELDSHYINVHIWGEQINVSFCKRCGKCRHDVVNDLSLSSKNFENMQDVETEIVKLINEYDMLAKHEPKERLMIQLTNFMGLDKEGQDIVSHQLTSLKDFIKDLRNSDSDATGTPSDYLVQNIVEFITAR